MDTTIVQANYEDLQSILQLQYDAFQTVAEQFCNKDIQPLKQTLEELIEEYHNGIILKMTDKDNNIIGSIRAKEDNGTVYIGKLIVHPEHRRHGYATRLLQAIEEYFTSKNYELFTSTKSPENIRLYQKMGYQIFSSKKINEELEFVYMEKRNT